MRISDSRSKTINFSSVGRRAATTVLIVAILGSPGCKTASFSAPKLPNFSAISKPKFKKPELSKLAFWKTENLMRSAKGKVPQPPSRSFDPTPLDSAVAASTKAGQTINDASNAIADNVNGLKKPLRKLYGTDATATANKLAASNGFNFDANAPKATLPNFGAKDANISKAQQDFNAALASSTQAIEKSIGNQVDSFKSAANDFKLPEKVNKFKANADQSLLAVNKSLYDSAGKLASNAKKKADNAFGGATTAANNQISMFEERLRSAAASTTDAIAAKTQPVKTAVSDAQSEVAKLKAQLAEMQIQKQKLLDAAKQQAAQVASLVPAAPLAPTAPFQQASQQPFANATHPATTTAPLRTASSNNRLTPSTPGNMLRGNFSPVNTNNTGTQADNGQLSNASGYPSTPHSSYATPTTSLGNASNTSGSGNVNSQTNFQQNNGSNLVISASTPVVNPNTVSHVAEVNIPESVLRGNSTYSPGSVHPLRR